MKALLPVALLTLVSAAACSRGDHAAKGGARKLPGDAVWFRDGVAPSETGAEDAVLGAGLSAAFLPARRLTLSEGRWERRPLPPPPAPFSRLPVALVITGDDSFESALANAGDSGAQAVADAVWLAIKEAMAEKALFGRVTGIHLDLPVSEAVSETAAKVAKSVRKQLPSDLFLIQSLLGRGTVSDEAREKLARVPVDGWVAPVFGGGSVSDTLAVDSLGSPWWAVYSPGARGTWKAANGFPRGTVSEKYLALLTDNPEVDFAHDLSWKDEAASAFLLRPRKRVAAGGLSFGAGDSVSFYQPALSELFYRLGADLAGRRSLRGRIVALDVASEGERIFTLAALTDVMLGHALFPSLTVTVAVPGRNTISIGAENAATHASAVSRTSNWVELDIPSGGIRDVQTGGFDRYEVYDAEGRAVTVGRAVRVRFFETLLGPHEKIESATISVRRPAPAHCCRWRSRVISSAGKEFSTDWVDPVAEKAEETKTRTKARVSAGERVR